MGKRRAKANDEQRMKHIPGLNGLRAVAVLAVVWHHARQGTSAWPIGNNGFLGVDIFFVLSGFLITALLLEEQASAGKISLGGFYWRRMLRIFPLYFGIIAALSAYFIFARSSNERAAFLAQLPTNLLFLSNWFPSTTVMAVGWSLSTEEQFYFVWPPLVAIFGNRSLWFLAGFLAVNQAVNFGFLNAGDTRAIAQVTFTPIILGSLLAFAMRSGARAWFAIWTRGWRILLAPLLLIAIASTPGDVQGWPRLAFHLVMTVFVAGIALNPESIATRTLEWKPLAYIGTVSYGVYLLHEIVLGRLDGLLAAIHLSDVWRFPACLALTVMVASVSYRFFERPIMAWRRPSKGFADATVVH